MPNFVTYSHSNIILSGFSHSIPFSFPYITLYTCPIQTSRMTEGHLVCPRYQVYVTYGCRCFEGPRSSRGGWRDSRIVGGRLREEPSLASKPGFCENIAYFPLEFSLSDDHWDTLLAAGVTWLSIQNPCIHTSCIPTDSIGFIRATTLGYRTLRPQDTSESEA